MNFKSIQEYEKDLKDAKKRYDKLTKQIKKCRSEYQYEMLCEDLEDAREDVVELQLIIKDLRKQKKLAEVEL
jgi:archaellum component FlaC